MDSHRRTPGRSALKAALTIAGLLMPAMARAEPLDRWDSEIARAAVRFGLPEGWVRRVMRTESGGRTIFQGRPIVSRAGAIGLMQLMPGTWDEMRAALSLGPDPNDPADNIVAGTAYLRLMYDRFGYPGLFAAYNAGPARYAAYLSGSRGLPAETRAYVAAIAPAPRARATMSSPPDELFISQGPTALFTRARSAAPMPSALFVALSGTARR